MAMKKVRDAMAAGGKYIDASGQEKTRWLRLGALLKRDNGRLVLKLDCIPVGVGEEGLWIELFEVQEPKQQHQAKQQVPDFDPSEDIPF